MFSHLVPAGGSDPSLCSGFQKKTTFVAKPFTAVSLIHSKKSKLSRSLVEMGIVFRWTIACLLFALAAGVMAFNKMTVCSWMRRKNPAATISIVGGCLGAAGCLMSPLPWLNKAWWLPTVLDMVGAPYLLILCWIGVEKWLKRPET